MRRDELELQLEGLHPASFRWALSCARNVADAEDVLQTAYLKVLDGRARFDGRSSFKTWLFSVIRRTASEGRRSFWARMISSNGDGFVALLVDPEAGPLAGAESSEDVVRLRRALNELPRRQRQMVDLVFGHDLTVAEASAALGIGIGSGRVHYHRGKRRLLAELGGKR